MWMQRNDTGWALHSPPETRSRESARTTRKQKTKTGIAACRSAAEGLVAMQNNSSATHTKATNARAILSPRTS